MKTKYTRWIGAMLIGLIANVGEAGEVCPELEELRRAEAGKGSVDTLDRLQERARVPSAEGNHDEATRILQVASDGESDGGRVIGGADRIAEEAALLGRAMETSRKMYEENEVDPALIDDKPTSAFRKKAIETIDHALANLDELRGAPDKLRQLMQGAGSPVRSGEGDPPGIVAKVNGRVLLERELELNLSPFVWLLRAAYPRGGEQYERKFKEVKEETFERLINDEIAWGFLETLELEVPDHVIDRDVERIIREVYEGSEERFDKQLKSERRTRREFRAKQKRIFLANLLRARVCKDLPAPTPEEIKQRFEARSDALRDRSTDRITFQKVFIPANDLERPGFTAEDQLALAEQIAKKLREGADCGEQAREHSKGAMANKGGLWKDAPRDDFAPVFAEVVFASEVGSIVGPLKDPVGFTIVKVLEIKKGPAPEFDDAVRERMRREVEDEKESACYQEWLRPLREASVIEFPAGEAEPPPTSTKAEEAIREVRAEIARLETTLGAVNEGLVEPLLELGAAYREASCHDEAAKEIGRALKIARAVHPDGHHSVANALDKLGRTHRDQGDFAGAESAHRESLAMRGKLHGGDHVCMAISLNGLGSVLRIQGNHAEAEESHRKELQLRREFLEKEHSLIVESLNSLAVVLTDRGESVEAEALLREALGIAKILVGEEHLKVAPCLNNLAEALREQGRLDEAKPLYERAIAILRKTEGPERNELPGTLSNLGIVLRAEGRLDEAEARQREALAMLRQMKQRPSWLLANCLVNLATVLRAQEKPVEAEKVLREAIAVGTKALGAKHQFVSRSQSSLVKLLCEQGKFKEAEEQCRAVLSLLRELHGTKDPAVARCLGSLASILSSQRRFEEAEKAHREALAIWRALPEGGNPGVANSLHNLAVVLMEQNKLAEAEKCCREALEIRIELFGKEHNSTAASLNNLGVVLVTRGRFSEGEARLRKALAVKQKLGEGESESVAEGLANLSEAVREQGRFAEAERLAHEALAMMKELVGEKHPDIPACLNSLALALCEQKKYKDAETIYRDLLKSLEAERGADQSAIEACLCNLAGILREQGRVAEAEPLLRKSLAIGKAIQGSEDPATLNNLAKVLRDQGKFEEADAIFVRNVATCERMFPGHPNLAKVFIAYAVSQQKQGRFAKAKSLAERALGIQQKALRPGHPDLAETLEVLSKIEAGLGNDEKMKNP